MDNLDSDVLPGLSYAEKNPGNAVHCVPNVSLYLSDMR